MTFYSILFRKAEDGLKTSAPEAPAFFGDLYLDQIIDAITVSKEQYNLKPFFYHPLTDLAAIHYRQEVMRELENKTLFDFIRSFAHKLETMRKKLAQAEKLYYKYQKERLFLEAVAIYCDAVDSLAHDLSLVDLKSRGFLSFREYLADYASSERFTSLFAATKKLKDDLSSIQYCLLIKGSRITVRKYESEIDYSAQVLETFEKFKQGAVKDYRVEFFDRLDMNHIEAKVLDLVAELYPETFLALDNYCTENLDYVDEVIGVFDREVQFYIAYLEFAAIIQRAGLKFCYPKISTTSKEVFDEEGFDLALAYKLILEKSPVICNDFYLKDKERIIVVTGPNQGGKTTFARTFGQLHYLACLGCPVPGKRAQLFLFDQIFTHFGKEEDLQNLRGKLQDDLVRIREILNQATSNSILIINEIFNSTTISDAIFLGKNVMEKIMRLDALCVCVTFIDELAFMNGKTVSMMSTVIPENPALRTYKILRKPADGLSYALSIAKKYRLTYEDLKERMKP
jgi:DNA mismatch repair protein MutS